MLLDLRHINFDDERDDALLAREASEAADDLAGGTPIKSTDLDRWERKEEEAPVKGIVQDMSSDGWDWVRLPGGLSIDDIPEQYRASVISGVRDMAIPTPVQEQAMRELGLSGAQAGARFRDALAVDLDRWERKAVKAVKAGRSACVRFESNAIPIEEQERIRAALGEAKSTDEVRAAFTAHKATEAPSLISSEWDAAMEWAKQVVE